VLHVGSYYFTSTIRHDWKNIRHDVDSTKMVEVQKRFQQLVARLHTAIQTLKIEVLSATDTAYSLNTAALKAVTRVMEEKQISVNLVDENDVPVVYTGHDLSFLPPSLQSTNWGICNHGPFTFLFISTPLPTEMNVYPEKHYTVTAALPITIAIPINNRFLKKGGFEDEILDELGFDVKLVFPKATDHRVDHLKVVPLMIGADTLALAASTPCNPTVYLQRVSKNFDRAFAFIVVILLLTMTVQSFSFYQKRLSLLVRCAFITLHLWLFRYILLAAGIGLNLFPDEFLRASYYASSFGWGLATSIGELSLTTIILLINAVFIYRFVSAFMGRLEIARQPLFIFFAVFTLLPFVLRAYISTMRSFVFDSAFNFENIIPILDEPMLLLMLMNIFLFTASFAFLLFTLYSVVAAQRLETRLQKMKHLTSRLGAAVLGILIFWLSTKALLVPLWVYLSISSAFVLLPAVSFSFLTVRKLQPSVIFIALSIVSTVCSVLAISSFMDERRRGEIELIADELTRPVDSWTKVLVEQTLQHITKAKPTLAHADRTSFPDFSIAFELWASSPLSNQPNNTAIFITESDGTIRSRFAVGLDLYSYSDSELSRISSTFPEGIGLPVHLHSLSEEPNLYAGFMRLHGHPDSSLRAIVIVQGTDPISSLRQNVDIIRNSPTAPSLAPEDHFDILTFRNGLLVASSDPQMEKYIHLPSSVLAAFEAGHEKVWAENISHNSKQRAYYAAKIPGKNSSVIAVVAGNSKFLFSVYRWLRIGTIFLIGSLIIVLIFWQDEIKFFTTRFSFHRKLLFAFLFVAAVPITLIMLSAKTLLTERVVAATQDQLSNELNTAQQLLMHRLSGNICFDTMDTANKLCHDIAFAAGNEINVYKGRTLLATSKPELYFTGLLNSQLNPMAYYDLCVSAKDFTMTQESIGDFSYYVGYKAIRDSEGSLLWILSTPTLFQQTRSEEEYIRSSATLFLGSSALIIIVLLLSTMLARQISKPLKILTRATRNVAEGNLERVVLAHGSSEVEELTEAFNSMTSQLQQSRRELAAAERELAWKEMARQVAHEIRNPLTPMKLAAQHLKKAWQDGATNIGEVITRVTDVIIDQIQSLTRISEEFAQFARMPKRETTSVVVTEILDECISLFRHHESISFLTSYMDDLSCIRADREELSRVITNVIRNAVQAIQGSGRISIATERRQSTLFIRIEDSGAGIALELLPHIFEPNFSTKTEGMGMGLAIVKKIVDDSQGTIEIHSSPNIGTTVLLSFPLLSPV